MYDLGLPSSMGNTLQDLNIGTYHDIATVRPHNVELNYCFSVDQELIAYRYSHCCCCASCSWVSYVMYTRCAQANSAFYPSG